MFVIDGNSATFISAIMTLSVLCFFNLRYHGEKDNSNNYIQGLLEDMFERAASFFDRNGNIVVHKIKKTHEQLKPDGLKIDLGDDKNKEILQLFNEIQIKNITGYQNTYLNCRHSIGILRDKLTRRNEFMSSFFFAFLFCLFILSLECLAGHNTECLWLRNVVMYVSATSLLFLLYVWIFYFFSIKRIRVDNGPITYEFRFHTIFLVLILLNSLLVLLAAKCPATELSSHILFASSVLLSMLGMSYALLRKGKSVFTRYFMLVHFFIIVLHSLIFCIMQRFYVNNNFVVNDVATSKIAVLAALCGGLVFPLFVPLLRMICEVELSNFKLRKAEKNLNDSVDKMIRKLEEN